MNKIKILNAGDIKNEVRERLTFDGRKKVFEDEKKLSSEFMDESAEPEAFTKEFVIEKVFNFLELEKLPEKQFETPTGKDRSVDYRIKNQKGGIFLVEAKPINADLFDKSRQGAVNQIKGLFKLVEVKENYDFGVATDGFKWVFIDRNGEIADELNLENNFEEIKEFLAGKEKVISRKTEEEISKKFYAWYNALLHGGRYKDHEGNIKSISEQDCFVNNVLSVKEQNDKEQIAQVVMNRLIFIKFLQSKNVIGEDVLRYLSGLDDADIHSRLKQLFFAVLNTPVDDRSSAVKKFGEIPYLNGSLFTPTEVENKNPNYEINAGILRKVIEFLDSFKFVHRESFESKSSLDPEILGYIFERAMTATDRKGTGAYYTPKQITKYISENTIYPFIVDRANEFLMKEKEYKEGDLIKDIDKLFILAETTLEEIWIKILMEIKVLDNACGSGAFLLAAANILFDLNKRIAERLGTKKDEDIGIKKLILINNIFGVDLNPNATEIAKLRLWLWLVDSYDSEHIQPLPNIDYNIRCGNSLIGYTDVSKFETTRVTQTTLNDFEDSDKSSLRNLLNERINLLKNYKPSSGAEAKELKNKIHKMNEDIRNLLDVNLYKEFQQNKIKISTEEFLDLKPFHWGFEFYNVMESGGFDVVIGNPPYVRQELIKDQKPLLEILYPDVYTGTADLSVYFVKKSLDLTKPECYHSFIITNKWLRAGYGKNLRNYLTEKIEIDEIIDFNGVRVFVGATVDVLVYIFRNTRPADNKLMYCDYNDSSLQNIERYVENNGFDIEQEALKEGWHFYPKEVLEIKKKIEEVGTPLEGLNINLYRGVTTGFNEAFMIDEETKNQLVKKEPKSAEIIKPILRGRDIERYGVDCKNLYLIAAKNGINIPKEYPAIYEHLLKWEEPLKKRWDKGDYWYNLRRCAYYQEFEKPKIVSTKATKEPSFVLDLNGSYMLNTSYLLSTDNKAILAILNSKVSKFYLKNMGSKLSNMFEPKVSEIKKLPIPELPESQQKPFIELADKMLSLNERLKEIQDDLAEKARIEKEIRETDKEIDKLVYELYGLAEGEIKIIEGG